MAILEDFEEYEPDGTLDPAVRYDGKAGPDWGVSTAGTFSQRPIIRNYDAATPFTTPTPAGGGTTGVWFQPFVVGNFVTVDYDPCSGLGLWLFHNYNSATAIDSNPLAISWAGVDAAGGINVAINAGQIVVMQWYDDGTYDETTSTTAAPTDPLVDADAGWYGAWMDISLRRGSGWAVRNIDGTVYLAADFPWPIAQAASWSLSCEQRESANRTMVDNVYGFPGNEAKPVTRLYPRDDGRGMSSAPRVWPPSRANRIIGGFQ